MLRATLIYGTLLLLAGASAWLLIDIPKALQSGASHSAQGPRLYLDHFVATRMNAQGMRIYTLSGPRLQQLAEDQGTEVADPHIETFRDATTRAWKIDARSGWLSPNDDLLILSQDVKGERRATASQPALTLTTQELLYRPHQHSISSDKQVRLTTAKGWLQGIGLRADLDTRILHLLWQVRGMYAPPAH